MSKFASPKDKVVYRATLNGFGKEELGSVEDIGWHCLLLDFYGKDYIVSEDWQGFVTVDSYDTTFTDHKGDAYRSAEACNNWVDIFDAYTAWMDECDSEAWED